MDCTNTRLNGGSAVSRIALRMQSDARLLELCEQGSSAAFETLVERYHDPLLRYCARMLDPQRAEDVVQQTFESAYTAFGTERAPQMIKPWLYRVAHNLAINTIKRKGSDNEPLAEDIDGAVSPDTVYERGQELRSLVGEMQQLPERQRTALLLRELEGRSYEEIAQQLDASLPNVRKLVQRARTSLRDALGALLPVPLLRVFAGLPGGQLQARFAELGYGAGGLAQAGAAALVVGAISVGSLYPASNGTANAASSRGSAAAANQTVPVAARAPVAARLVELGDGRTVVVGPDGIELPAGKGGNHGHLPFPAGATPKQQAAAIVAASLRSGEPISFQQAGKILRSADPSISGDQARAYTRQEIAADRAERSVQKTATRERIADQRAERQQLKREANERIRSLKPGSPEWKQAREDRAAQLEQLRQQQAADRRREAQVIDQREQQHRANQQQRRDAAEQRLQRKADAREQRQTTAPPDSSQPQRPARRQQHQSTQPGPSAGGGDSSTQQSQPATSAPQPARPPKPPKPPKAPKPPKPPKAATTAPAA